MHDINFPAGVVNIISGPVKEVADTLRAQKEPDIDALIPMVDKALAAYKVCKERLTAVKTAFGERLPEGLPE